MWDFIYDETAPDGIGLSYCGILCDKSAPSKCLFYVAREIDESDVVKTCFIYSSISNMFLLEGEEVSYPWTAANDSLLLGFLNNAGDNYSGEKSGIRNIKFETIDK